MMIGTRSCSLAFAWSQTLSVLLAVPDLKAIAAPPCPVDSPNGFRCLLTYRGIGAVLTSLAGPGPTPGSQRFYQSYIYSSRLELVSLDPETGAFEVFTSPVEGENAAWALAWGKDDNLYVGTLPHAHLLRLDPRAGSFVDLGRPSESEQYIWGLTLGSDGKLYGGTYPSAKLIRFDPETGVSEDLGRMDPAEQYAHSVAASGDGFIYIGIGYGMTHVAAYEIATGQHRDILPEQYRVPGVANVHRRNDGQVYATSGTRVFRLAGWEASLVPSEAVPKAPLINQLNDGRLIVQAGNGVVQVRDSATDETRERPFRYEGSELGIFRLGVGPDGWLYGSGFMPAHWFRVDPRTERLEELGVLGPGELYSILPWRDEVIGALYGGPSPIVALDPTKAVGERNGYDELNPHSIELGEPLKTWRPLAAMVGHGGQVFIGAQAEYGKLGGPMVVWNPATNAVERYHHLIEDQSVASLTRVRGWVVGGTTIYGGSGANPTTTQARLFLWDTQANRKTFEMPVEGTTITDLVALPDGRVYGFVDDRLFVFEPADRRLTMTAATISGLIYNSALLGREGLIWGLCREGVFYIDLANNAAVVSAQAPEPITAGFAAQWPHLYYASGSRLYRYTVPSTRRQ